MQRGLVDLGVTDEHRVLLREAAEHARGADAPLLLVATVSEERFERDLDTLSEIGEVEGVDYSDDVVLDGATTEVERLAREVLGDGDVEYDVVSVIADEDDRGDLVIEIAEEHGCDHVFMVGRKRSPAGKALFGDAAQKVVLDFDGYVTLATR